MHPIETVSRQKSELTALTNVRPVQRTRRHSRSRFGRLVTQLKRLHTHRCATEVFSRYLFAIPIRTIEKASIIKGLLPLETQHVYVPLQMLTDKGSALESKPITELEETSGIKTARATMKHGQTIDMIEWSHQN